MSQIYCRSVPWWKVWLSSIKWLSCSKKYGNKKCPTKSIAQVGQALHSALFNTFKKFSTRENTFVYKKKQNKSL